MASSSAVISTLFTSLPLLSHASTLFDTESSLYFSDANENPDYVEYRSVDEGYRIQRPSTWEQLNKAGADAFFRDPQIKKATLGVTVLPVKITTLSQFGSLEQVAEKLESAERAKESTIGVHMVTSTARDTGSGGAYDFIYELESTRGRSTIAASVMIVNSKLYIVNGIVPCWRNKCNDMGGDRLLDRVVASARSLEVSSR